MEKIICKSCGNETPGILSQCTHCGEDISADESMFWVEEPKERNVLASIYLWGLTILYGILTAAYFVTLFTEIGMLSRYEPMWSRFVGFIVSGATAAGFILLLRWMKAGYVLLMVLLVISLISCVIIRAEAVSIIAVLVGMGILNLVVYSKKNGKSLYSQLS